jgi:hypothetical protein
MMFIAVIYMDQEQAWQTVVPEGKLARRNDLLSSPSPPQLSAPPASRVVD